MGKQFTVELPDEVAAALESNPKGDSIQAYAQSILVSAVSKQNKKPKAETGEMEVTNGQSPPSSPQGAFLHSWRDMLDRQAVALWICGELRGASDRAAGVLGGAFVDDSLTDLIKESLKKWGANPYCEKLEDKMFRHQGPLGSFSSRTDIARLLGIIGPETHADLDSIREIRNICAHWTMSSKKRDDFTQVSFESTNVRSWCDKLRYADGFTMSVIGGDPIAPADARSRFILTVSMLGQQLVGCTVGVMNGQLDQAAVRNILS